MLNPNATIFVISQLPPPIHGSTIMTKILISCLQDSGLRVTLIDKRFSGSISEVGRVKVQKIFGAFALFTRVALRQYTHSEDIVIHFATTRRGSFAVDWFITELLRLRRLRSVGYLHTVGFESLRNAGPFTRWAARRVLSSYVRVVCLDELLYRDVEPQIERTKLSVVRNTLLTPPRLTSDISSSREILFFSNLIREKGAKDFIRVAAAVAQTDPATRFILAGTITDRTHYDEIVALIAQLDLQARIELHLSPSTDQKWLLLERASALIFPSIYAAEAQPLTIIEAFYAGTPVIAYNSGAIAGQVSHEENGFLVARGDWRSAAQFTMKLLASPKLQQKLANGARSTFDAKFSMRAYQTGWMNVLEEASHGRK